MAKKKKEYTAYADGASYKSGNGLGSSAYLVLQDGKPVCERSKAFSDTNFLRVKMLSIISAVNFVPKGAKITVYSDFELAVKVFTKVWTAQKNLDLIELYDKVSEGKEVTLVWEYREEFDLYAKRVKNLAYDVYHQHQNSQYQVPQRKIGQTAAKGSFAFVPRANTTQPEKPKPMVIYPDDDDFYSENNPFQ